MTYVPFIVAGLCGLLLLAMAVLGRSRPAATNAAAHRMGRARSLEPRAARQTAARLGVKTPGLTIGHAAKGGRVLRQGWEDTSLDIAGPRVGGKTTLRVNPAILEAPGAVVTTSNKPDSWRATREKRSHRGPVWTFDPQGLTGEPGGFTWDPLSYATDEVKAAELADVFAAAHTSRGDRSDSFFAPKAAKVVAALLLAAATSGRTIDQCYRWVTNPRQDEPVDLLRDAGYPLLADSLQSEIDAPEKQRGGIFGTAEKSLAFLTNRRTLDWCIPDRDRAAFDPHEFVRSTGTLYSLSKEGRGSAGALVAALTLAVVDAAEEFAKACPAGRLPVPLVVALDEAANVNRWPDLPALYSHFGSRGIILMTWLQSYSQGVSCWGEDGMQTLWSAASVKVIGAGVAETDFLARVSRIIGDRDEHVVSIAHSRHGRTTTRSTRRRHILDVADLASLPRFHAVVLKAGDAPVLAKLGPRS